MITILFFAQLKEQLGQDKLQLAVGGELTVEQVKQKLVEHNPDWQSYLQNNKLLAAVNQDMVSETTIVKDGDEVAFFPPVTGG